MRWPVDLRAVLQRGNSCDYQHPNSRQVGNECTSLVKGSELGPKTHIHHSPFNM